MKKIIKLLFIILISIAICSCGNKKPTEGQLIEISAVELTNNFYGKNSKDFIFAIINEHKSGYMNFEKDLERFFNGCDWKKLHHQFIHFGRYHCKAKGMLCNDCKLKEICKEVK